MSQTLYLYYIDSLQNISESSHIKWLLKQDDQALDWQQCQLGDLAGAVDNIKAQYPGELVCTLILSVENLLCTQITLPGKQAKHLKQALPFLVEEKLAIDVDSMHFAIGSKRSENRYPVVAVEHDKFSQLLQWLKDCDLEPSLALGDAQLLKPAELYIGDSRSLLSLDNGQSIAVENDDLELILNSAFNDEEALESTEVPVLNVNYSDTIPSEVELQLQVLDSAQSAQVNTADQATPLTDLILDRLESYQGINLLQGEFASRKKKSQSTLKWQPFAIAAAVLLALQLSYFVASGLYFSNKAETYASDTEKLYRALFPQDRRIRDVKRQAQAHLKGASGSNTDFIGLLGAVANSWKNPNNSSLEIEQLRFSGKRGQMTLEIQAKSINQLDTLQREISEKGIKAELMSANESDKGVRGRLQLGG